MNGGYKRTVGRMKKNTGKMIGLVALLTIAIVLIYIFMFANNTAVNDQEQNGNSPENPEEHESNDGIVENDDTENEPTEDEKIAEFVNQMSLEEKIGQLIIGGFEGTTMTKDAKQMIRDWKLGGIILFANNLETPEQSMELLNGIKKENKDHPLPLFISVDQEGGRVTRLPELSHLPTNLQIGQSGNEENAYKYGELLANQLHAFGFNMNFAPVLDVNSNPNNPVIGNRSFGDDPQTVSDFGIQMMRAMQDSSIISAVKHFPGHGDTKEDSHESLPVINKTMEELSTLELLPFEQAISNGVDIVMTAHILLPEIDADYPATLSPRVITNILREQLGYNGVVITDDLTMGAITNDYGVADASLLAIQAGVDLVLVAHGPEPIAETIERIRDAVESGELTEERINESVTRIVKLKNKYELNEEPVESIDIERLNQDIDSFNSLLGSE